MGYYFLADTKNPEHFYSRGPLFKGAFIKLFSHNYVHTY